MKTGGSNKAGSRAVRSTTALVLGALTASAMWGCSSDTKPGGVAKTRPIGGVAKTRPAPPSVKGPNPLTGVGASPSGPVIAVKLDDTAAGRPSLGVDQADVIYIEEVEGGLSRMVAVFAGARPRVRAVRSIRNSDPELLGQYGRIIVVASGGARTVLRTLDQSTLHSVVNDRGQVGFQRDPSRPAPYNVVSDLARVSVAIKADGVRNVGFTWAANDPRLALARTAPSVATRVGATPVGFVWDTHLARYVRTVDGRRIVTGTGAPVAKPNVLVQFCQVVTDPTDRDVNGKFANYTKSVGTGRVVLFRGGRQIPGTWSRPTIGAPTTFTDDRGKPLWFAPGGTFVALARPGSPT